MIGGRLKPVPRVIHVSEKLARSRGARIDIGRPSEVTDRRLQLVASPVGFAAHQVADHRIALESDRAAERLDCRRQIAGSHRRVSPPDLVAVVGFPPDDEVAVDGGPSAEEEERHNEAFHRADSSTYRQAPGEGTSWRGWVLISTEAAVNPQRWSAKMAQGLSVKPVRAITWTEVGGREAALIQRCAARDEQACAELVNEHQRMVYQLSLNLLGDHNEALDLSQEVFLRVFRTIHTFRGQSALRTWIFRIVINQARNRQRWWRRRHRSQQVSLDEHIRDHGDPPERSTEGSPDRVLGQKLLADRIRRALDELPFDQRTALVLREIDGLSYDEIGFSLGIAVGTVKSRLARAREALRAELRDE